MIKTKKILTIFLEWAFPHNYLQIAFYAWISEKKYLSINALFGTMNSFALKNDF